MVGPGYWYRQKRIGKIKDWGLIYSNLSENFVETMLCLVSTILFSKTGNDDISSLHRKHPESFVLLTHDINVFDLNFSAIV